MTGRTALVWVATVAALAAHATCAQKAADPMNELAERYVRLVLAVGQHDADYVDAYYGPADWRTDAEAVKLPLADIAARAEGLATDVRAHVPAGDATELVHLRHGFLTRQIESLRARVSMLEGRRLSFDDESRALYDAMAPPHSASEFSAVLAELDAALPGHGTLLERYDAFRSRFVIPRERLAATIAAGIEGCRARTREHIALPPGESFTVEYVTGKSWGAYNWYQGGYRSVIQVNTDLPVYVDRAVGLACHEGYPGHHVYNVLREKSLVKDLGWIENTVYPLFSPQSLIAEGSANYGVTVAFPADERVAFEREVVFPAAGLDPAGAGTYARVMALVTRLDYAGNEAARQYLDGQIDAAAAARWLAEYGLLTPDRALQRVRFIDQYRSYVINYNLGQDMVKRYVESQAGSDRSPDVRWRTFAGLISSPRLPSGLGVPAS